MAPFHLSGRRRALRLPQAIEIKLAHVFGAHALRRQCAQSAIQARIDLLLNQRLGNRELEVGDQCVEQPVRGFVLYVPLLIAGQVFAQFGGEVFEALVVAQLLGELVVQLGLDLFLDAFTSTS